MVERLKEKIKEPVFWMFVAAMILQAFTWASYGNTTTVDFSEFGEDAFSTSMGVDIMGFDFLVHSVCGYITMVFPILALIYDFLDRANVERKIVHIVGSLLSIVGMVTSYLAVVQWATTGDANYGEVETSSTIDLQIPFWLEILVFVGIIVVTLVKGYGISKEDIANRGVKAVVSEVAENVVKDTARLAQDPQGYMAAGTVPQAKSTQACPSCGNPIAAGKKFCAKCGTKIEVPQVQNAPRQTTSMMTVSQYIQKLKTVPCQKCGSTIGSTLKFCPNCGSEVIVYIEPDNCTECGEKLIKGKTYCANCGAPVRKKRAITNCSGCGAELFFGKNYCTECGKQIESEE